RTLRQKGPHHRPTTEQTELGPRGDHGLPEAAFIRSGRYLGRAADHPQRISRELRYRNQERPLIGARDVEENRAPRQSELTIDAIVRGYGQLAQRWRRGDDLDLCAAPLYVVASADRAYNQEREDASEHTVGASHRVRNR